MILLLFRCVCRAAAQEVILSGLYFDYSIDEMSSFVPPNIPTGVPTGTVSSACTRIFRKNAVALRFNLLHRFVVLDDKEHVVDLNVCPPLPFPIVQYTLPSW